MGYIPPGRPGSPPDPSIDRYYKVVISIWLVALVVLPPLLAVTLVALVYR